MSVLTMLIIYDYFLCEGQEYHSCTFNDPENPFKDMQDGVAVRPDIYFAATLHAHKFQLLTTVSFFLVLDILYVIRILIPI